MKVLLAASEVAPIIKVGGLGDVVGSLPKALEKIGVNADVIVPFFPSAKTQGLNVYKNMEIDVPFNNETHVVSVYSTKLPGSDVDVMLLNNDRFFTNWKNSAFANSVSETEVFTFFCRCIVEYLKSKFNTYDVVHCNDWHTGLVTHLLVDELDAERPGTLFTIHNLMYQGIGTMDVVREAGILPGAHPLVDYDIQDGDINLLFQGITSSDFVNAVSESYAKEILTEEYGKDLADVLKAREGRLSGILNGIDYTALPRSFDLGSFKTEKKKLKSALQKKLGLKVDDSPVFAFISRLDSYQKGLDILYEVIPSILENEGQFVLLGTGDPKWEETLKEYFVKENEQHQGRLSINITFDINLANDIYAASDFLLIPSRYEPCGLTQMVAMYYGTLPIVHAVGGLKDTVENGVNGFSFDGYVSTNLALVINKALEIYRRDGQRELDTMIKNAMRSDFGWGKSAQSYKSLYEKIVKYRSLNI